ncbi:MAG TPA: S8 family serine peptidase [Polyangiaceae bacterium]|nr:S8 family serine peptidase [Polyangiaceae bacterium]
MNTRLRPLAAAFVFALAGCQAPSDGLSPRRLSAPADAAADAEGDEARGALILLNSVPIDRRTPAAEPPPHLRAHPGSGADDYALVKYPGPITAAQSAALRAAAQQVYTYLPHDTFLVKMAPERRSAAALGALGASWAGPYHPLYKLSRFVRAVEAPAVDGVDGGEKKLLMVEVYPDADLDRVARAIEALGVEPAVGRQQNAYFSRARFLLSAGEIARVREQIARLPEVFWVDLEGRRALRNDTTVSVGQAGVNAGGATPVFAHGIHGEGQVVAVLDTGIDPDMCYFRDGTLGLPPRNLCNGGTLTDPAQRKVIAVDFLTGSECNNGISNAEWDTQDHGSHVAGTVAGDNLANPVAHDPGDGMAPGAKLVIQDGGYAVDDCGDLPGIGCPVVDLNPIFQQTYDQGARIHTNSWGDNENASVQNNYSAGSQDVDQFMWEHKDFLIFFAAGNSGPGQGSVGSPATAKSGVAVGATQRGANAEQMASFSSCGPTDDGRMKPELTMPGSNIVSANSDQNATSNNCNTKSSSGTSMATPGAAGLAALVRQYYADGFYPSGAANAADAFAPSAALVKATLVNSARAMAGVGPAPADCQGFGRVLLDDALYFPSDVRRIAVEDADQFAQGSSGEARSYTYAVAAGAPFKATLAWTDFPSTPAASPHLVNDLDLTVTGPDGTRVGLGSVAGEQPVSKHADRLGSLEQVTIAAPVAGQYTVTVRSFNVPFGPQPFALVVTANLSGGARSAPLPAEPAPAPVPGPAVETE